MLPLLPIGDFKDVQNMSKVNPKGNIFSARQQSSINERISHRSFHKTVMFGRINKDSQLVSINPLSLVFNKHDSELNPHLVFLTLSF